MSTSNRVLSVGQCGPDHGAISRFLRKCFSAEVEPAETPDQALGLIRSHPGRYTLVLVNRVCDLDGELGIDLIRALKADAELASLPIMLVSNLPEAQAEAQAAGALPGFGKSELGSARSLDALRVVLGAQGAA